MELPIPPNSVLQRAELLGRILVLHWTDAHRSELLLEAVRGEFDADRRYELLRKIHRIVGQDYPYTWLWCGQSLVAVSKRWDNVKIHKLGVRYQEWYLADDKDRSSEQ